MAENASNNMNMEPDRDFQAADDDYITFSVQGQNGRNLIQFKMKRCVKMKKALWVYCQRRSLDYKSTLFLINGQPFDHDQSPAELVLEDLAKIEVTSRDQVMACELVTALVKITI